MSSKKTGRKKMNEIALRVLLGIGISIIVFVSFVMGQHSVWRYLRAKKHVVIDKWCYTAENESATKYWE